jgi:tetratricopeptide (TPR) repeat protein
MLGLLANHGREPAYVAYYAETLLRRHEVADARGWLARLEELEPKAFRTLRLKALVLKEEGRAADATPLLQAFVKEAKDEPKVVLSVAGLLEGLGEFGAAEEMYRRHVDRSQEPTAVLNLAAFLGRQKKTSKALDLCERAWKTCPAVDVAQTCVLVLSGADGEKAHGERVEHWLREAAAKHPEAPALLLGLGLCQTIRGRYDEAEVCYRKALQVKGVASPALNNLAWLLSFRKGKGEEALALAERAIERAGPQAALLDTRALAYMAVGKHELAVKDLEEALTGRPSAVLYFHLAQAHLPGSRRAAAEAWAEASRLGLREGDLAPLERAAYQGLRAEFARP